MLIYLKPICPEILGALSEGYYDVENRCTAKRALICCIFNSGLTDIDPAAPGRLIYMLNGKHISPDTTLSENDRLMVLRPVYGG